VSKTPLTRMTRIRLGVRSGRRGGRDGCVPQDQDAERPHTVPCTTASHLTSLPFTFLYTPLCPIPLQHVCTLHPPAMTLRRHCRGHQSA
jgi:hypothetical protein